MANIEEIFSEMEISRITNESLQQELENVKIQNEILKWEKKEIFGEIIDLEFKIKKFGAVPKSMIKEKKQKVSELEENKGEEETDDENKMKWTIKYDVPEKYFEADDEPDVNILGNFTSWIPEPMEKDPNIPKRYIFTANLERGFKHRYQFLVNEDELIDETKKTHALASASGENLIKSSINPTGSKTNYIMVPFKALENMQKGNISSYMSQELDSPSLLNYPSYVPKEIAKVIKSHGAESNTNESEKMKDYILDKMRQWVDIQEKKIYLQTKIEETKEDKKILQAQYKDLDDDYCRNGRALKKVLEGRLMHTNDYETVIYEIKEYLSTENQIKAKRVYDLNQLLILDTAYQSVKWFNIENIESEIVFLSINQEARVRLEMMKEHHTFKIHYQIDSSTGENICLPMSIHPVHIHMSDYNINFNKQEGVIQDISNNTFGQVKFKGIIIDQNAGFISNSTFEVWTNEVNENVYNIVHCHINDMSDSVPIATEYLKQDEEIKDHSEFKTDAAGQTLRYKILIQDHKIISVLYNTGADVEEIPFQEYKLDATEQMMQAIVPDVFGDEPIIVHAYNIPKSMGCANDKKMLKDFRLESIENEPLSFCKMRYFERLPGLIDVRIISADNWGSLYEGEYKFALPACLLKPVDDYQKTMIVSMQDYKKETAMKGAAEAIEELEELVIKYSSQKLESTDEVKEAFQSLKTSEEKINNLLGDEIENEELIQKAKEIAAKSSKILRFLAAQIRMNAMKSK